MKIDVQKLSGFALLLLGASTFAFGGTPVPEIDPGTATVPFALIGAAILIVRSRIRR
jgi:hypothetical protein